MAARNTRVKNAQAASSTQATAAGSQTGVGQAGVGASYQSAGAETISDIGQAEAYIVNLKSLVERAQALYDKLDQVLTAAAQRNSATAGDLDASLRSVALQAVQNAVTIQHRINQNAESQDKALDGVVQSERERTARMSDVWDVVKVFALGENPIFQDAIDASVAKAMAAQKKA